MQATEGEYFTRILRSLPQSILHERWLLVDLPVRMALGETHVIALTKAALAEAGVSVEALEDAATRSGSAASSKPSVDRSETVILVKNLPYSASEGELMVRHLSVTIG